MEDDLETETTTKRIEPNLKTLFFDKADRIADEIGNIWVYDAACQDQDPELWYPDTPSKDSKAKTMQAVGICFECPVRLLCLKAACIGKEKYGIWGGLDASTRRGQYVARKAHDYEALSQLNNPYE